jgi:hypothetical protein
MRRRLQDWKGQKDMHSQLNYAMPPLAALIHDLFSVHLPNITYLTSRGHFLLLLGQFHVIHLTDAYNICPDVIYCRCHLLFMPYTNALVPIGHLYCARYRFLVFLNYLLLLLSSNPEPLVVSI